MAGQKENTGGILKTISRILRRGSTPAKILFLLVSVFMWLLIKLSKQGYDAVVDFPVKYENVPPNKSFKTPPPEKIRVNLTAGGFDILKYQFQSFISIKVDVSRLGRTDAAARRFYWLTNSNLNFIEDQLGEDVEVISISPDTVFFDFSRIVRKKVPVNLNAKKHYSRLISIYNQPKLIPDSVTITGPEQKVENIKEIKTRLLNLTAQEESLAVKVPLMLPEDPDLQFSHTEADVQIKYTQMTQGSFEVPVEVINLPEKYNLKIFPQTVELTYHVAIQDYQKVAPADFMVYANFKDITERPEARYLNLAIEAYPAFVNYVNFEPKRVEFILTEK